MVLLLDISYFDWLQTGVLEQFQIPHPNLNVNINLSTASLIYTVLFESIQAFYSSPRCR